MKRYVVIASVLVIIGGASFIVYDLTGDTVNGGQDIPNDPTYACYKCGKTFTLSPDQYAAQEIDQTIARKDPMAARRPHCPLCNARHSGFMMVACPSCGKYYLPPMDLPRGSAVTAEDKDVCPYCKTDRAERYRSNRENQ